MQTSQDSLPKARISSAILIVVCIIGSCLVGNALAYLTIIGALSFWHPVNSSPIHAVEILDGDRNDVWVKTNDGKIMTTDCPFGSNCSQWNETDDVPDLSEGRGQRHSIQRSDTCVFEYISEVFYPPPGKVRECVQAIDIVYPHQEVSLTIYALLEDGSVWYWAISWSSMGGLNSLYLVASTYCPMFGFIFALAILFIRNFSGKTGVVQKSQK